MIEDFIRQNREAFDDQEPSPRNWKKIEATWPAQRPGWWQSVTLWRAAAMLFMALSAYLLLPKEWKPHAPPERVALNEFKDVEAYYVKEISNKVALIDAFQRNEGVDGFTQDFQQLEAMYMVLKEEMQKRPSDQVKDALVLNLLVRIDLLNQQLHMLEKERPGKKPDAEI
ncbi:hypothetical protein [Dawidia soli]|uniref:Anti-sigma factor n=1 Tax=Dawidia soli TaxID=2782352 RepID=A0AAP2DAR5_9BACT|nr:hypothetical protein [Dawidia soli]MBT1688528.1 hypothetical protein [Dawidia soli]